MADYTLIRTNGGDSITVNVGQQSGPSSGLANQLTDIDLYGRGALNWGRGVDQNQLRLLENFACPQIVRPNLTIRPVNSNDPAVPGYTPNPVRGTGINKPILGQQWHNTSDGKMYQCTNAGTGSADAVWEVVGSDPDLFLPLAGGTMTGALDLVSSTLTRLTLTSDAPVGTPGDIRFELNDLSGTKGLIALNQGFVAVGDPHPQTGVINPGPDPLGIDTVIIRKQNNGFGSIVDIRLQDNGVDVVQGFAPGAAYNSGTIRTQQTTLAMPNNTLTTKLFVADNYADLTGADFTGNLTIESNAPQFTIRTTDNDTSDAEIRFEDSTELKFKMTMIQWDGVSLGNAGNVDSILMEKWKNGGVAQRLAFRDDFIAVEGGAAGARVNGAGTIRSLQTMATDHTDTLTTKGYVESTTIAQGGDTITGSYFVEDDFTFGGFGDTVFIEPGDVIINNSSSVPGTTARIEGGRLTLFGVDGQTQIREANVNVTNVGGSANIRITSADDPAHTARLDFSQNNTGDADVRGSLQLMRTSVLGASDEDALALYKYGGGGNLNNPLSSLVLGDTSIDLDSSVLNFSANEVNINGTTGAFLNIRQGTTSQSRFGMYLYRFGFGFGPGQSSGGVVFINLAEAPIPSNTVILTNTSALADGPRLEVRADELYINRPLQIGSETLNDNDEAQAARHWKGAATPPAAKSSPGDTWYDTANNVLYLRTPTNWTVLALTIGSTVPLA